WVTRPFRLFGVLLWYVIVTALLYLIWLVADPSAGGEARLALVPLILVQQLFVFIRLLVKVGYYAGVSEALSRDPSPADSYVPAPADSTVVATQANPPIAQTNTAQQIVASTDPGDDSCHSAETLSM